MFRTWIPLAHGAFGIFDELLAVTALVVFIVMLIAPPFITWLRRQTNGDIPEDGDDTGDADDTADHTEDHYRLD